MDDYMKEIVKARRIVIKIGTSTLTHHTGNLNIRRFEDIVRIIADMKNAGKEIVIVSSGAIAIGVGKIGLKQKPRDIPRIQAVAAIGQCELMYLYDKAFGEYNQNVSQVLITYDAIESSKERLNFCNTFNALLGYGVIPIVNENDTVSTEELENGDNDTLSAIVAGIVNADLLIMLTDVNGLYDANPSKNRNAKHIELIEEITPQIKEVCEGAGDSFGTGGMVTKLQAAEVAFEKDFDMIILSSQNPNHIYDVLEGKNRGTLFRVRK